MTPFAHFAGDRLPYDVAGRLMGAVYGARWVQRRYLKFHAAAMEPLLKVADAGVDRRRALQLLMLGMRLDKARLKAVGEGTAQEVARWFPESGFEKMELLLKQGRRVIALSSHVGAARILPLWLARRGVRVHSLEGRNSPADHGVTVPENLVISTLQRSFLARVVFAAKKALEAGWVVHLTGDGGRGTSGIKVPFLGREKQFMAGFAELALATDAVVVPVLAPHDETGGARLSFLDPLDTGTPDQRNDQRIGNMVREYAALLEKFWKSDPGNVRHGQLDQFAKLPLIETGPSYSFDELVAL
jgi:hypothetical protein